MGCAWHRNFCVLMNQRVAEQCSLHHNSIWASGTAMKNAASEDRTHDFGIMRPTRYQLRYSRSEGNLSREGVACFLQRHHVVDRMVVESVHRIGGQLTCQDCCFYWGAGHVEHESFQTFGTAVVACAWHCCVLSYLRSHVVHEALSHPTALQLSLVCGIAALAPWKFNESSCCSVVVAHLERGAVKFSWLRPNYPCVYTCT